mmetsp:Transcript_27214/g.62739  ORF Transcript_27214/g.62739 Transcript_27214/m.62739 type:complete len:205 (+) Transcript_27214:739-1353(+)
MRAAVHQNTDLVPPPHSNRVQEGRSRRGPELQLAVRPLVGPVAQYVAFWIARRLVCEVLVDTPVLGDVNCASLPLSQHKVLLFIRKNCQVANGAVRSCDSAAQALHKVRSHALDGVRVENVGVVLQRALEGVLALGHDEGDVEGRRLLLYHHSLSGHAPYGHAAPCVGAKLYRAAEGAVEGEEDLEQRRTGGVSVVLEVLHKQG